MSELTFDQAYAKAAELLAEMITKDHLGDVIFVESAIRETKTAWYFPYDGRTYITQGDISSALAGNIPIKVPRDGGDVSFENPPSI